MRKWIPEEYRPIARLITTLMLFAALLVAGLIYLDRITGFVSSLIGILSPFLVGGALAFIQMPIARRIEGLLCRTLFRRSRKPRAPRVISAIVSIALLILALLIFLNILLPQVVASGSTLVKQVTAFVNENDEQINSLLKRAGLISADVDPLNSVWQNILSSLTQYMDVVPTLLRTSYDLVYSVVFKTLIGLIISFYLLIDSRRISRKCKRACYALMEKSRAERLILWSRKANRLFAGFTTGKIVDSIVVGVLCYLAMLIMGLEYPLLISVIIGVTNVLPFFGPFIGAIPSILILAIVNPPSALKFAIFILILQQLDGNLIGPKILGDYVGISPLLTMAAILIGSGLLGFVGLIISVPVCALLYALVHTLIDEKLARKGLPTDTHSYDMIPAEEEQEAPLKASYLARIRQKLRERKSGKKNKE